MSWTVVCETSAITPNTGVCAWIQGSQIAIFRVRDAFYALGNHDPFSDAAVLSRGIIGDRGGVLKVASPIYKQNFALDTGECLDDENVSVPSYKTRVRDGMIEVMV